MANPPLSGANHYQYQDTSSFLEDFNDGDASLTQEEQIDHAMEHILPYFDLTLRGDHSKFRDALIERTISTHHRIRMATWMSCWMMQN